MKQRVRLTWWAPDSKKTTEFVQLLHEDTSMFTRDGTLIENGLEKLVVNGRVLFEDAEGQFTLRPNQIIEIKKHDT